MTAERLKNSLSVSPKTDSMGGEFELTLTVIDDENVDDDDDDHDDECQTSNVQQTLHKEIDVDVSKGLDFSRIQLKLYKTDSESHNNNFFL